MKMLIPEREQQIPVWLEIILCGIGAGVPLGGLGSLIILLMEWLQ